jgi:uncharacterized membrane protein
MKPDYVPQALTASGVFALYASVYAAHALFGLIGIPAAFVALAAVSFAGLVLAVRQGWFWNRTRPRRCRSLSICLS